MCVCVCVFRQVIFPGVELVKPGTQQKRVDRRTDEKKSMQSKVEGTQRSHLRSKQYCNKYVYNMAIQRAQPLPPAVGRIIYSRSSMELCYSSFLRLRLTKSITTTLRVYDRLKFLTNFIIRFLSPGRFVQAQQFHWMEITTRSRSIIYYIMLREHWNVIYTRNVIGFLNWTGPGLARGMMIQSYAAVI